MVHHKDKKCMKKMYCEKSDDRVWERLLKIVRDIIQISIKKEVTKNHQGKGFDGQIGIQKDLLKIGNLIEGQCLIYIFLWFGLCCLHCLLLIPFLLSPTSHPSTMSDIYCHEDILNFTNPFLNYKQGH